MTDGDRMERAGNYVLGLMDDSERERAERDLEIDPSFRDAVVEIAERMHVFDRTAAPDKTPDRRLEAAQGAHRRNAADARQPAPSRNRLPAGSARDFRQAALRRQARQRSSPPAAPKPIARSACIRFRDRRACDASPPG